MFILYVHDKSAGDTMFCGWVIYLSAEWETEMDINQSRWQSYRCDP